MSTPRGSAIARVTDAIRPHPAEMAEAIVDAIYPEITDAKQMVGVPEGSVLIAQDVKGTPRPYVWLGGHLRRVGFSYTPAETLEEYGKLTVVWMP